MHHATGIDLTPAMLDRARALQAAHGLTNVSWVRGDVLPLPCRNGAFTIVTARFAFHTSWTRWRSWSRCAGSRPRAGGWR